MQECAITKAGAVFWIGMTLICLGCTSQKQTDTHTSKIRSVTLDARNPPPVELLPNLKELGISHVTLVQFGFQQSIDSPEIRMNPNAQWYSESDLCARELAQSADSLEMKIILKPHLWLGHYNSKGQARSSIGFSEENLWQEWEADYTKFLLHYAHLAEQIGAEILVIGTELARSTRERPQYWQRLIATIRMVYKGQLTYAANWWKEYEEIQFWNQLDYVGIQAYFELSNEPTPTNVMLTDGWKPHIQTMSGLSKRLNRPVLFTELGYRSISDAAAKPWRWPSHDEIGQATPKNDIQVQLYHVFFNEIWHEPWFQGAILWKWHGNPNKSRTASIGFTPQGKPAEALIRQWFTADK